MHTSECFPRNKRLLRPAEFANVFGRNYKVSDRYWTILARHSVTPTARLGMAIAKKRAKRAVDRNRLKRVVREHFRCNTPLLDSVLLSQSDTGTDAQGALDLVIMNRDAAVSADNEKLRRSLETLFQQLVRKCKKLA